MCQSFDLLMQWVKKEEDFYDRDLPRNLLAPVVAAISALWQPGGSTLTRRECVCEGVCECTSCFAETKMMEVPEPER